MHSFRQLNCLEIIESYNSLYLFPDSYFTIDLLNGCQKLTHLTIIYNNIETKLLEDIHLYLPQLTNLKITTNKTTITQNFLVNMNKLKVIRIKGKKLFRNSINLSQYHYRSNEWINRWVDRRNSFEKTSNLISFWFGISWKIFWNDNH